MARIGNDLDGYLADIDRLQEKLRREGPVKLVRQKRLLGRRTDGDLA